MGNVGEESLWTLPPFPEVKHVVPGVEISDRKQQLLVWGVAGLEKPTHGPVDELMPWWDEILDDEGLSDKAGSHASVTVRSDSGDKVTLAVYNVGATGTWSATTFVKLGAFAATQAKQHKKVTEVLLVLPELDRELFAQAAVEGVTLGAYKDQRWKLEKKTQACCDTVLVVSNVTVDLVRTRAVCESIIFARQLVNAPANVLNAAALAACMQEVGDCYGLTNVVLDREECQKRGMGLYMAVAQGAESEPKFIHTTYTPLGTVKKKVVLVGKGITFDSGGYNLKIGPESLINCMKFDMGGAATIFAALRAIAHLQVPHVEVHCISAACENLISGAAYRPGDVITASNGKTVEVVNTDAEGRMTLADALTYADELGADYIVDVATLTGSMIVALGNEYAGVFSPEDDVATRLVTAATDTGENLWRMPFVSSYRKLLESNIADLKQLNTRAGDCINAAVFLKEFVTKTKQWAHVDIAPTCWQEREGGATGYGVRALIAFVEALSGECQ